MSQLLAILREEAPGHEVSECAPGEVPEMAREVDVLVPLVAPITAEALSSPRLRLVQQFGVGLDSVDIAAASSNGVYVANVPSAGTANSDSVAELTVFHMLALARRFRRSQESLKARRVGAPAGTTLLGKTAVIVGFGGIGKALARRLGGFGMRLVAVSKRGPRGDDDAVDLHVSAERLHEVLAEADFVIVATPLGESTRGLIGRDALAHMKPSAFLVNVARGGIVDRDALLEALRERKIAGAGLDVYWTEPPDPEDPLFSLEVFATPHIGGATDTSFRDIARAVVANVERLASGATLRNAVNLETIDREALEAKLRRLPSS